MTSKPPRERFRAPITPKAMQSDRALFSPPNIPSLWLDRAIKQSFTGANTRAPAHTRASMGSGWLYRLEGQTYYSPTCLRPDVKIPRGFDETDSTLSTSTHDYKLEHYQYPQWWSKASSYLGFTPLRPDLSAPPLYPLLRYPDVLDSPDLGPHPDPGLWSRWQQLQDALVEATHLLLKDSGAAAVRSMPYPCARVDRNVESRAYIGRKAQLYRDISLARSLFEVWFGCLSYAIAVNEAIINQVNAFSLSSRACIPLSWVELILAPYQERKKGGTTAACALPPIPGTMAQSSKLNSQHGRQNNPSSQDTIELRSGGIIDPSFVSSLRNTCIAKFDGSVERVGLFIKIPERPEEMISIDWLLECNVPVWYAWGQREEAIARNYPVFARYRPPPETPWVTLPPSPFGFGPSPPTPSDDDEQTYYLDSAMVPLFELDFPTTMKPEIAPYEKRPELREWERNWEQFFAAADSKEQLLIQMETPEMKQEREVRNRNPPTTRPEAKFYVWERGMRGTFKRRVARDEELEGIFEARGKFGKSQGRYNSFYNEWDLCRYWGPPDDEQLLHRAKIRANLRGTSVEGELLWWRVYYGLQPEPSSSGLESTAEDLGGISAEPSGDLECTQFASHALDQRSPDKDTVKGNGHDMDVVQYEMEEGELEDSEIDVSWMVLHAYHFLGFTMCPRSPDSATRLPIKAELEAPAHAPRLIGGQGTGQFWASTEGQAIIQFAKCLASNSSPPKAVSWDLSRWNAMPITSLPLFKRLNFFQGQVKVQVEAWDNVRGRSTPKLIFRMETAYWLDIPSDPDRLPTAWYIGTNTPELALALCRIGGSVRCSNPVSIAWYLATKGVPFQTWFKRRPEQIRPLAGIRASPELIQFRLESQCTFGERDYQEYVRCRRRLLDGPAGRAAVKMGGIIWRLATEDIGIRDVLSGVPSEDVLCGQRVVRQDGEGSFLVDDGLNLDEIMAICGEYEVGVDEGNQRGHRSWWPSPDLWEEYHGSSGWSPFAEAFFQSRLAEIQKNFKPIARSGWRKRLHPSASLRKAREKVRAQSAALFGKAAEGGL
ncbi:hypothetical protein NMY22_g2989 [Coprinellus aureogranulatus]|nr:hypothetical protein NMY22_g2989 [Coprinellus aureogranulatus]